MAERKGRVEGKMAFITGGAQGLGKAAALMLAKEGAKVTVADINAEGCRSRRGRDQRAIIRARLLPSRST